MELTTITATPHSRPLLIRPHQPADAQALHPLVQASLEQLSPWLPWAHTGYVLDEARAWIAQCTEDWRTGSAFAFGVFDAANGSLLGGTGLNQLDKHQRCANLGYWIGSAHHGQGIATAAAARVAAFAFSERSLARVEIAAALGNRASQRVAEKLGARFEGHAHGRIQLHGQAVTAALYSLSSPATATRTASGPLHIESTA